MFWLPCFKKNIKKKCLSIWYCKLFKQMPFHSDFVEKKSKQILNAEHQNRSMYLTTEKIVKICEMYRGSNHYLNYFASF